MVEADGPGPQKHEDDTGICQVCLTLIDGEVKMCPSCSAIFCNVCINNLPKAECPICRKPQFKDACVRNRPLEEIIQKIRFIKNN